MPKPSKVPVDPASILFAGQPNSVQALHKAGKQSRREKSRAEFKARMLSSK